MPIYLSDYIFQRIKVKNRRDTDSDERAECIPKGYHQSDSACNKGTASIAKD